MNVAFPLHTINQNYRIEMLAVQIKLENAQIWWLYKDDVYSPITIWISHDQNFLILHVKIGHVYNVHHSYKSGNLRQMEVSKRQK